MLSSFLVSVVQNERMRNIDVGFMRKRMSATLQENMDAVTKALYDERQSAEDGLRRWTSDFNLKAKSKLSSYFSEDGLHAISMISYLLGYFENDLVDLSYFDTLKSVALLWYQKKAEAEISRAIQNVLNLKNSTKYHFPDPALSNLGHVANSSFVHEISHFDRLANGAYGGPLILGYMGKGSLSDVASILKQSIRSGELVGQGMRALTLHTGLSQEDVLLAEWTSTRPNFKQETVIQKRAGGLQTEGPWGQRGVVVPAHYLAVDRRARAVVLAIRYGTTKSLRLPVLPSPYSLPALLCGE